MKDIHIPISNIGFGTGPGSQSTNEEENLDILNLPSGMDTFAAPILPEPEDITQLTQGKQTLEDTLQYLKDYSVGTPSKIIDLGSLDTENLDLVNQAMGEGEVSATLNGPAKIVAQESVLAGVWRVQHLDTQGSSIRDTLEIADVPHFVREVKGTQEDVNLELPEDTLSCSNAPSILTEINDQLKQWSPGDDPHVINLSLLPLTNDELLTIGSKLGVGPITILSRGYGNCRIGSTDLSNVWWIKYYNSEDSLILNTIEICDVPAVALAAQEDIDDSAHRLDEILELYR